MTAGRPDRLMGRSGVHADVCISIDDDDDADKVKDAGADGRSCIRRCMLLLHDVGGPPLSLSLSLPLRLRPELKVASGSGRRTEVTHPGRRHDLLHRIHCCPLAVP